MNIEELKKPLSSAYVRERNQAGFNLSYLEAHHCIREANRIFGHDAWIRETCTMDLVQAEQLESTDKYGKPKLQWYVGYVCKCRVTVDGGVIREGTGFGQGVDRDLGRAHESATKEAESDGMKRALMTFGDPFGLALYDKERTHVVDEQPEQKEESPKVKPKGNGGDEAFLKTAGEFLKSLDMTPVEFKAFKADCAAKGMDWVQKTLAAKEDGVTTLEGLIATVFKENK